MLVQSFTINWLDRVAVLSHALRERCCAFDRTGKKGHVGDRVVCWSETCKAQVSCWFCSTQPHRPKSLGVSDLAIGDTTVGVYPL